MKVKRTLMALLSLVCTLPMLAQYNYSGNNRHPQQTRYSHDNTEIYYGLRLGLSMATVNSDDQRLNGGSVRSGLNVGAIIGFELSNMAPIYLEAGAFYTEKGGKGKYENKKFTYSLNYLELPVVVKYQFDAIDDLTIQPLAGGYLGVGINGKVKNYADRQAADSFDHDYFKRLDAGLRLGCGIEYQMLYAELAYDLGLANICHDDFDTSRNRAFYINIGVNF